MKNSTITITLTPELRTRFDAMVEATNNGPDNLVKDMLRIFEHLIDLNKDGYDFLKAKDGVVTPLEIFKK